MSGGKKAKGKKMGRPKITVDFAKVDAMSAKHCTAKEIADYFEIFEKISYDTIERRIKEEFDCTFAEYVNKRHSAVAKPTLRKAQMKAAEEGNATMLIWLGKQYLDQRDHRDINQTVQASLESTQHLSLKDDETKELLRKLHKKIHLPPE